MSGTKSKSKKNGKPGLNLLINIAIPAILMMKGQAWFGLPPIGALSIALLFPLIYGIYDLVTNREYNFFSILGFLSVLLTGGIGLLHLPKEWIAIKEAAIPLIIGFVILLSIKSKHPLVRTLLYNDKIIDIPKVESRLKEKGNKSAFEKRLVHATYLITFSFLLSATLNYALAKIIIKSETGTQAFTEELGKMTAWSYPVIALPCTVVMLIALWWLFSGIKKLTGLEFEAVFHHPSENK